MSWGFDGRLIFEFPIEVGGGNQMKIIVTGGAGFVGTHLVSALLNQGHNVESIDNLSTGSYENAALHLNNPGYFFHRASLETLPELEAMVESSDVVFHLAASVGVKNIVENPIHCIENNVFCTSQLLKWAHEYKKRIITFSTSEVYGKSQKFPFSEEDDVVLGPSNKLRWAYAASKLLDDYLAQAYAQHKGMAVTIVRLFNTIGQRQVGHYGMVVPRFFEAALSGGPITIYGTGQQTRCFTDVRDVVNCLLLLIDCKESLGELINIGTPQEVSMTSLAKRICEISNSSSELKYISYEEAYGKGFEDMERRVPNNEKLKRLTGYTFKHDLNSTLEWIHEEFKNKNQVVVPRKSFENIL